MKLGGGALLARNLARNVKEFFSVVSGRSGGWGGWSSFLGSGVVREPNSGDWQKNLELVSKEGMLAFSAVYACVSLIADDIAKLPLCLERLVGKVWLEVQDKTSPYYRLFRKPNGYQTPIQFISAWIISKLLYGNTYIFLERNVSKAVVQMHILDPRAVTVLVTEFGDVYYRLLVDHLAGVPQPVTIPESEILHDRMLCLWHPLVGVSPIVACGHSTTQGLRIQGNSAKFFENMSRPSGHLTAPGEINEVTAKRLKEEFERNFSGGNIGRLLVTGDGLKYEALTIPPEAAQLIEQLKWTVEDVARCFKIPLYKLGIAGANPPVSTIGALNQEYYSQTLQIHIQAIESLLNLGLDLPEDLYVSLEEEALLRMDPLSRAERAYKEIGSGMLTPNEARAREDLPPVKGGDTPYMQQQNYSLAALDRRDEKPDPFESPTSSSLSSSPPQSIGNDTEAEQLKEVEALADLLIAKFRGAAHVEN